MKSIYCIGLLGILLGGCNSVDSSSIEEESIRVGKRDLRANRNQILDLVVSSSRDDAEQRADGSIYLNSSDLELVKEGTENQVVGIRFNNINIPKSAIITKAYIQFSVDEVTTEETNLIIHTEESINAQEFTQESENIRRRDKSSKSVNWEVEAWNSIGERGIREQTPDISSLIQERVDKDGWEEGNSIAFIIEGRE